MCVHTPRCQRLSPWRPVFPLSSVQVGTASTWSDHLSSVGSHATGGSAHNPAVCSDGRRGCSSGPGARLREHSASVQPVAGGPGK